jgi:spore cortex formation protein SpoVR/YcgB (stage V sporulation)
VLDAAHCADGAGRWHHIPPQETHSLRDETGARTAREQERAYNELALDPGQRAVARFRPDRAPSADWACSGRDISISWRRGALLRDLAARILRIVRHVAAIFPIHRKQTKMIDEGCATFVHLSRHEPAARHRLPG